jgi:micrococcal nuclease
MRRLVAILVVVGLVALAVWIITTQQSRPTTSGGDPGIPIVDDGITAPPDAHEMTVVDITDGDTLRLRDDSGAVENVRLVGIDTPEVYPEYECYGDEAEAELLRLAPVGSTLLVDPDIDPFDDYGRLLLYLWNDDGTFINLALVDGGFAEAIRVAPNDLYFDELLDAENGAATAGLGMWGSC